MKKYLFLLIIPILLLIPSDVFAEQGIDPIQNEIFWRAENISTGDVETAQYVYTPGLWTNFGTNDSGFNLMTLGSFLTYQQTQGTYAAKITYSVSTTTHTYVPEILSCGVWSSDVSNATCSIESGTFKDNVFTYVVNYRWTNSSGFIQLTFNIDNGLYLIPKDTRFMYHIDSFLFNPSQDSIIIGQNQTIINQNQTIIDNQTQNTQDIINNQNENTDKEIESQKICSSFDINSTAFQGSLNSSGEFVSSSRNDYVTDFIKINSSDTIKVIREYSNSSTRLCFYNDSKSLVGTCTTANLLVKNENVSIPTGAKYVRFTISKLHNAPQFEICKNGNQALNDTLTDDTPPSSDISSLGNVQGLLPPGPVDSLLNIPFKFLSVIVSSLGNLCVPLSLDFVFNSSLTLPCFSETFYDNVPSGLMIFINLIPTGFILIKYFKHLYMKVNRAVSMETTADDEWGVL